MDTSYSHILVEGVVEHGDQRGRELGFPTANLPVGRDVVRRDGVWAGLVHLLDESSSSPWVAAVSVGRRPTFYGAEGIRLLEAHLIGFGGDLYGRPIRVELCKHLRPMRAFDAAAALVHQLEVDVADTGAWAVHHDLGALLPERPQHNPGLRTIAWATSYAERLLSPLAVHV